MPVESTHIKKNVRPDKPMGPSEILRRTFSEELIQLMKNRVITSFYKYGDLTTTKRDTRFPRDELKNALHRIRKYKETGNTEYIVDAMNFLMFEYMEMKGNFIATEGGEIV